MSHEFKSIKIGIEAVAIELKQGNPRDKKSQEHEHWSWFVNMITF